MLNLSYTISPDLKATLEKIEVVRRDILATTVPRLFSQKLRWDCLVDRVYYSCLLGGDDLSRGRVGRLLAQTSHSNVPNSEKHVHALKTAFDYIDREWFMSDTRITGDSILKLSEIMYGKKVRLGLGSQYRRVAKQVDYFLDYLQSYPENPLIQAAIAQAEILEIQPFVKANDIMARLTSYLFLYKYGYDVNGMLVVEDSWSDSREQLESEYKKVLVEGKLTPWIEFYTKSAHKHVNKIHQVIVSSLDKRTGKEGYWKLNERQRAILQLLAEPGSSITNRVVQKKFSISQITASRDLTKMVTLGLVFAQGKGRSVYYILS